MGWRGGMECRPSHSKSVESLSLLDRRGNLPKRSQHDRPTQPPNPPPPADNAPVQPRIKYKLHMQKEVQTHPSPPERKAADHATASPKNNTSAEKPVDQSKAFPRSNTCFPTPPLLYLSSMQLCLFVSPPTNLR